MKVPLTQGKYAIVDKEDFERLSKCKWQFDHGYAVRSHYIGPHPTKKGQDEKRKVYMHREVVGATKGQTTDHKDGDRLDNRSANLRLCSELQNHQNQRKRSDNKSGYKGVSWSKKARKWEAYITVDKKRKYLGLFDRLYQAAEKYNTAAKVYFGEYANLNNIKEKI